MGIWCRRLMLLKYFRLISHLKRSCVRSSDKMILFAASPSYVNSIVVLMIILTGRSTNEGYNNAQLWFSFSAFLSLTKSLIRAADGAWHKLCRSLPFHDSIYRCGLRHDPRACSETDIEEPYKVRGSWFYDWAYWTMLFRAVFLTVPLYAFNPFVLPFS